MEDQAPYRNLMDAMKEQKLRDEQFVIVATTAIQNLNLINSQYAEMLVRLADLLTSFAMEEGEDMSSEFEIDPEYGKGVNLYRIVGALQDYEKDDGDEVNLDLALAYIFREKERRWLNEIE
jgi:hypothetical protein